MAIPVSDITSEAGLTTVDTTASEGTDAPDLRLFVFALFFIFGGITSLNDIIAPKLKDLFTLNYTQTMLIQSAFFAAYFFFSIPAAAVVRRVGYMRGAALGLLVMAAGCLLFIPAARSAEFIFFLLAVFVLGAGITLVQVVANPLISMLGPQRTTHSRLTFAQAFNSLGTTIFPYVGSILILGSLASVDASRLTGQALQAYREAEAQMVVRTYIGLAIAILIVAAVVWTRRKRLPDNRPPETNIWQAFNLLGQLRFGWGALCIFLYVGGEVAIGTMIVNYLKQPDIMGLAEQAAGKHVIYYWGGAMVGRFIGAWLLSRVAPGRILAMAASIVLALLAISANTSGAVAGWSLLAIGLFNSIMFPTIFSLACEGLGKRAEEASGVICVAIVGGAIVPPILGRVADVTQSLQWALIVPALCYGVIAAYGAWTARPRVAA